MWADLLVLNYVQLENESMTLISIVHQKGKGCLSVAYSKVVAVQLTWAVFWWSQAHGRLPPEEGSLLPLFAHPTLPEASSAQQSMIKLGGKGVTFLASFKLHHFTKWSKKDH